MSDDKGLRPNGSAAMTAASSKALWTKLAPWLIIDAVLSAGAVAAFVLSGRMLWLAVFAAVALVMGAVIVSIALGHQRRNAPHAEAGSPRGTPDGSSLH